MTPHINCQPEDFAPTVIMPGDPQRSKLIAEKYLSGARLVNDVRGVQGYTGFYKDQRISVMASGMGGPSMGIYSHELFAEMQVERIIRVGTMGALVPHLKLGDIALAQAACYNSSFISQFKLNGCYSPIADFKLLRRAAAIAEEKGYNYRVGNILTSDYFYNFSQDTTQWATLGVIGVEMETAILYTNAALHGKQALAVLTVSDSVCGTEILSPEERVSSLDRAIRLALDTGISA